LDPELDEDGDDADDQAGDAGTAVYPDTATTLVDTHQRRAYGDI
jgi:hypothetical protein